MAGLNSKITLKLLIDARSNKVLFGEADKDFVDFMFSLLTLPLGSVIKLFSPRAMIGSIGKLYQSVEKLNEIYLGANTDKSSLLQPKVSTTYVKNHLLLDTEAIVELKYYICTYCNRKVTTLKNTVCLNCKQVMVTKAAFVVPSGTTSSATRAENGAREQEQVSFLLSVFFVKEVITYMITDDLEVTPLSAISSFTLISRFSIKNEVQLMEKVVAVGMKEGLALLKASLVSPTALTDADKDFVDFMFSLLTFPLGSVIKLLSPRTMIGSIGKLYQSVENLNEIYLVANRDKSSLLQPKVSTTYVTNHLILDTEAIVELKYYICNYCNRKVTTLKNTVCPNCKQVMVTEAAFVVPSGSTSATGAETGGENAGGFVKGVITYMITDDLEVTPMSAISSITLMNRFSMKNDVQLMEKVVSVGMKEGLALLKASLDSPTALTDVFCPPKKKTKPPSSSFVDDYDY
ncbi:hypothetical protein M5K25_010131 [Dendrobium thyrsiflorum]|uniref:Uncharacterized protein n=1 Tax=Dendrobium thyrsiflorum TaxID=117978 RepID=A0ABD0V011_DENTH